MTAQSADAVEQAGCSSAGGYDFSSDECPGMTLNNLMVRLQSWSSEEYGIALHYYNS